MKNIWHNLIKIFEGELIIVMALAIIGLGIMYTYADADISMGLTVISGDDDNGGNDNGGGGSSGGGSSGGGSSDDSSSDGEADDSDTDDDETDNNDTDVSEISYEYVDPSSYTADYYRQSNYPVIEAGSMSKLWVEFKNTGDTIWKSGKNIPCIQQSQVSIVSLCSGDSVYDHVFLGISDPQGRFSRFQNTRWIKYDRPATLVKDEVLPGEIARFEFEVEAPMVPGLYREKFALVSEYVTWMDAPEIYWDIVVKSNGADKVASGIATNTNRPANSRVESIINRNESSSIKSNETIALPSTDGEVTPQKPSKSKGTVKNVPKSTKAKTIQNNAIERVKIAVNTVVSWFQRLFKR